MVLLGGKWFMKKTESKNSLDTVPLSVGSQYDIS
jgi:hypothetical protein